ncbi:hypothetical protein [Desulforhabdus amnigena]|nr:hypothetical protein [Desulforhabdus amnigena]NLJ27995.1 hypothetical protein [Deltaproteobacteria bacterium]
MKSVLIIMSVLLSLHACKSAGSEESQKPPQPVKTIKRVYEEKPLYVRLSVDKDTISVAEQLHLTLEADAPEGYEARFPDLGQKLGEFRITDYKIDPPQLSAENLVRTRRFYTLEPFLAGEYHIAPMEIVFLTKSNAKADSSDLETHTIRTEELTVKVHSLLGEDRNKLEIHPIYGPVELPRSPIPLSYILAMPAAILCIGGCGFWWLKMRKKKNGGEASPPISPHEFAYRQLQEILEENFLDRGEFKLFFSRISDVVRYYIENRFGLHAPKLTTEEFLATVHRKNPFSPEHQRLLDDFLNHCDLVKFAEHHPTGEEAQKSIEACKAFIDATRQEKVRDDSEFIANR